MKTAADIIKTARATADEITTVQLANAERMNDVTRCILEAGRAAKGTKNVDKLFVLAQNVTAAGRAALSINNKTWNDIHFAYEMAEKARRSASAYAAAEERARRAGNAAKIEQAAKKSAAAKQAAYIIETAYKNANEVYSFHNREMNAALAVAASVIKRAKYAAAHAAAVETFTKYPATSAESAAEVVRRAVDARSKSIDEAAQDFYRGMTTDNTRLAKAVVNYVIEEMAAEKAAAEKRAETERGALEYMKAAQREERATTDAAIEYDADAAAASAKRARIYASAAEDIASQARAEAVTYADSVSADIIEEYADAAREAADNATETAKQSAAEAAARPQGTKEAARFAACAEQAARDVEEAETISDADAADNRAAYAAASAADAANRSDADEAAQHHAARAARAAQAARAALVERVMSEAASADAAASGDYGKALAREAYEKAGADPADLASASEPAPQEVEPLYLLDYDESAELWEVRTPAGYTVSVMIDAYGAERYPADLKGTQPRTLKEAKEGRYKWYTIEERPPQF